MIVMSTAERSGSAGRKGNFGTFVKPCSNPDGMYVTRALLLTMTFTFFFFLMRADNGLR
jgi:hypothetical protein